MGYLSVIVLDISHVLLYMCTLFVCIISVFVSGCYMMLFATLFLLFGCDQVVVVVLQVLHHLWMDFCSVVVAVYVLIGTSLMCHCCG